MKKFVRVVRSDSQCPRTPIPNSEFNMKKCVRVVRSDSQCLRTPIPNSVATFFLDLLPSLFRSQKRK